jgi:hypothetical protein
MPKPADAKPADSAPEPSAQPAANPSAFLVQPASYASPIGTSPAAAAAQPTLTQVFGVFARGTRFVYVFDRSASMEGRPLQAAKTELIASLADLTPRDRFQVIFYSDQPQLMSVHRHAASSLAFADESSKRLAARFIGGMLAEGSTNHLAALIAALQLQPDVIFFLTDTAGEPLSSDQLARIRHINRVTAIYTIEFGAGPRSSIPRPEAQSFLERLALENGGQHTYIDVSILR